MSAAYLLCQLSLVTVVTTQQLCRFVWSCVLTVVIVCFSHYPLRITCASTLPPLTSPSLLSPPLTSLTSLPYLSPPLPSLLPLPLSPPSLSFFPLLSSLDLRLIPAQPHFGSMHCYCTGVHVSCIHELRPCMYKYSGCV